MNAQGNTIPSLIDALSELRSHMLREEKNLQNQIQEVSEGGCLDSLLMQSGDNTTNPEEPEAQARS